MMPSRMMLLSISVGCLVFLAVFRAITFSCETCRDKNSKRLCYRGSYRRDWPPPCPCANTEAVKLHGSNMAIAIRTAAFLHFFENFICNPSLNILCILFYIYNTIHHTESLQKTNENSYLS